MHISQKWISRRRWAEACVGGNEIWEARTHTCIYDHAQVIMIPWVNTIRMVFFSSVVRDNWKWRYWCFGYTYICVRMMAVYRKVDRFISYSYRFLSTLVFEAPWRSTLRDLDPADFDKVDIFFLTRWKFSVNCANLHLKCGISFLLYVTRDMNFSSWTYCFVCVYRNVVYANIIKIFYYSRMFFRFI